MIIPAERDRIVEPYYPVTVGDTEYWRFREHEGQRRVLNSRARYTLALCGTQSGKTVLGPWWLMREVALRGPGDYLAVSPTYKLMALKMLPEFKKLFVKRSALGVYRKGDRIFEFSSKGISTLIGRETQTKTQIFFGHAQDPESLESATAKAAWLDEAGQRKFKLGSWEAIERRLSIYTGRVLLTTTPYYLGWMKTRLHDAALDGDPEVNLVQFASTMNPAFPESEFERMRNKLPPWKFEMMYRGRYVRPAGMIYGCWDDDLNTISPFAIPKHWKRHLGLDFGPVNLAGVFLAEEPDTGRYILYRDYLEGDKTIAKHRADMMAPEPMIPNAVGGSWSEKQWRREFRNNGLPVSRPPINSVEVGIDRVYELVNSRRLLVFNTLESLIDRIKAYTRVIDKDTDEVTEEIQDKNEYHRLDALRYIVSKLLHPVAATEQSHVKPGMRY